MKAGEFDGSCQYPILDSLVVRIPACHAGGRGSIPRRGGTTFVQNFVFEKHF